MNGPPSPLTGSDAPRAKANRAARVEATPTAQTLRQAALRHLARFATTRKNLIQVLDRRIERWAAQQDQTPEAAEPREIAASLRQTVRTLADRLVEEGLLNDAAYAQTRARRLTRAGRSSRAIAAHLAARGVSGADADLLPPDRVSQSELAAALATARRRRIGPFRRTAIDADGARRELAMLARAGFPRAIAEAALQMEAGPAERMVLELKRG